MAGLLSSTGTWTTLGVTSATLNPTGANTPEAVGIPASLLRLPIPTEIEQMIRLVMVAYGLNYWTAEVLLEKWLISHRSGETSNIPVSFVTPTLAG